MKQSDLDLLRAYAQGHSILDANGQPLNAGAARAKVASAQANVNQATRMGQQRLDNDTLRAQNQQQAQSDRQNRFYAQQAQAQQAQAQAQHNRNVRAGVAIGVASTQAAGHPIRSFVARMSQRAGNVPTPGGVFPLFLTAVLLASAVVPVNAGLTRLQLMWLTLLGQTDLPDTTSPQAPDSSVSTIVGLGRGSRGGVGGPTPSNPSGPIVIPPTVKAPPTGLTTPFSATYP